MDNAVGFQTVDLRSNPTRTFINLHVKVFFFFFFLFCFVFIYLYALAFVFFLGYFLIKRGILFTKFARILFVCLC